MGRSVVASLLAGLLVACGGGDAGPEETGVTGPPPTSTTTPPVPSPEPSPSASPSPRPIPPAWATPIEEDLAPDELDDAALVPPDAELVERVTLPAAGGAPDQVAVTYRVGDDPFAAEHGLAVWQRFDGAPFWSVVHAFVDAPEEGVLGITLQVGDLTGDGHDDVLTFEQTGGTGACGRWRVVAATDEGTGRIFERQTCDTEIRLAREHLRVREAVYEPDDPHCCPSAFRLVVLEWDGGRFVRSEATVSPASSP